MSLPTRHRTLIALLLAALVLPVVPGVAGAATDGGAEARFVQLLNQARARAGLPALSVRSDLVAVARRHSARMADSGDLYHNPSLADEVSGWEKLGENVGRGPTADSIHEAFMGSPGHRANIMSGDFTEVGVGVEVREGGRVWVTQVFRLPMGSQPQPEPAREPAPAPEAAPEPEPAPTSAPVPEPAAATASPAPQSQEPDDTVTSAGPEPSSGIDGTGHAVLVLAQLSARDLGMRVTEALPSD